MKPEGKLSVEYTYETFTFPDERSMNFADRLIPYPNGMLTV